MCIGVQTYAVYVGSLWYYDETGKTGYPYAAGPIIGIGAGMVFITAGYIATAYPEENEKGSYATMLMNMQGFGSVIGGIIPVIINRNKDTAAGVPRPVYISFVVLMSVGGLITLLLQRPLNDLKETVGSGPWLRVTPTSYHELALSSDGKLLAVAQERTVQIYDLAAARDSFTLNQYVSNAAGHYICGLDFEQDNHVLRVRLSGKGSVLYLGAPPCESNSSAPATIEDRARDEHSIFIANDNCPFFEHVPSLRRERVGS